MNNLENLSLFSPEAVGAGPEVPDTMALVRRVATIQEAVGLDLQTKVGEEIGELMAALMQTKTYKANILKNKGWDNVFEECADVIATIMVMCYRVNGIEQIWCVDDIVRSKLLRTIDRFEKGEPV